MDSLGERIALAQKHVEEGRRIVARQREQIANGEVFGADAFALLRTFERTLKIFEEDLDRLLSLDTAPGQSADRGSN